MMRTLVPAAVALAMSLSCTALADPAAPAPQPAPQPAAQAPAPAPAPTQVADKDKKICRMMYHNGELLRTQTCKTQEEWDRLREAQERNIANFQNRNDQSLIRH